MFLEKKYWQLYVKIILYLCFMGFLNELSIERLCPSNKDCNMLERMKKVERIEWSPILISYFLRCLWLNCLCYEVIYHPLSLVSLNCSIYVRTTSGECKIWFGVVCGVTQYWVRPLSKRAVAKWSIIWGASASATVWGNKTKHYMSVP